MSAQLEHTLETLAYADAMLNMDGEHLTQREEGRYMESARGIHLFRETPAGWWREHVEFGNVPSKQIEKHLKDKTVAYIFVVDRRYADNGGWNWTD